MKCNVGDIITINGQEAKVLAVDLPGPFGNNSIEYRMKDGSVIKDSPALSSYYGGRKYELVSRGN